MCWLDEIRSRGKLPVVVGGTGLYVRALAEGLFAEPVLDAGSRRSLDAWTARLEPIELLRWAARLDPGFRGGGRQRAARAIEVALLSGRPLSYWQQAAQAQGSLDPWYIVLTVPRPVLHQRIARRAEEMVRRGVIEEVASVLTEGHGPKTPGLDGIGIREAVEYLHGPARESPWRVRSRWGRGSMPSGRRPGFGISLQGESSRWTPPGLRRSWRRR